MKDNTKVIFYFAMLAILAMTSYLAIKVGSLEKRVALLEK